MNSAGWNDDNDDDDDDTCVSFSPAFSYSRTRWQLLPRSPLQRLDEWLAGGRTDMSSQSDAGVGGGGGEEEGEGGGGGRARERSRSTRGHKQRNTLAAAPRRGENDQRGDYSERMSSRGLHAVITDPTPSRDSLGNLRQTRTMSLVVVSLLQLHHFLHLHRLPFQLPITTTTTTATVSTTTCDPAHGNTVDATTPT